MWYYWRKLLISFTCYSVMYLFLTNSMGTEIAKTRTVTLRKKDIISMKIEKALLAFDEKSKRFKVLAFSIYILRNLRWLFSHLFFVKEFNALIFNEKILKHLGCLLSHYIFLKILKYLKAFYKKVFHFFIWLWILDIG